MAHWKYGEGFAIRYGGYRDIEWFHGDEFRRQGGGVPIPPVHPAALVLEAAKTIGLVLQWWEMRKQTQLLTAEFEERRLLWVADMLTTWGADIASVGTLRLDSTRYLERDLARLMSALISTPKMDVSSVLLLQMERAALALVDLNTLLYRELSHQMSYFDGPERDGLLVPDYRPFNKFRDEVLIDPQPGTFLDEIKIWLPYVFSLADPFAEYLKYAKRRSEFIPVENLMLELRQSIALLETARTFPPTLRTYSQKEVLAGEMGTALLLPGSSALSDPK